MENEINLADLIKVVRKYSKLIVAIVIIAICFSFLYSKAQPGKYQASATILPLDSSTGSLASALSIFGGSGPSASGARIIAVGKSRILAKSVIVELDLLKVIYKKRWDEATQNWKGNFTPSLEDAAGSISGQVEIKATKEGLLAVSFTWDEPELAARIANTYVDKLADFINNRSLNVTFQKVDQALPPSAPFNKNTKKNILMAGVGSLFVGVLLAFLVDYIKNIPH